MREGCGPVAATCQVYGSEVSMRKLQSSQCVFPHRFFFGVKGHLVGVNSSVLFNQYIWKSHCRVHSHPPSVRASIYNWERQFNTGFTITPEPRHRMKSRLSAALMSSSFVLWMLKRNRISKRPLLLGARTFLLGLNDEWPAECIALWISDKAHK